MSTSRVGAFPCRLWREASKELDLETLCVLAYLWTCPHRKIEGLFELPLGYVACDLNIPIEAAKERINTLQERGHIAYQNNIVLIVGYMSKQGLLQGKIASNVAKGIINGVAEINPSNKLLKLWEDEAKAIPPLWEALLQQGYRPIGENSKTHVEQLSNTCSTPVEQLSGVSVYENVYENVCEENLIQEPSLKEEDTPNRETKTSEENTNDDEHCDINNPPAWPVRLDALFRQLVSAWPADRVGDVREARQIFYAFFPRGLPQDEADERLKNIEGWASVILGREPQYVPRLDRWLSGLDVSISPPEEKPKQSEWVPVVEEVEVE